MPGRRLCRGDRAALLGNRDVLQPRARQGRAESRRLSATLEEEHDFSILVDQEQGWNGMYAIQPVGLGTEIVECLEDEPGLLRVFASRTLAFIVHSQDYQTFVFILLGQLGERGEFAAGRVRTSLPRN